VVTLSHEHLHDDPAGVSDPVGIGGHYHAVPCGQRTGCHQGARPLNLDHADPASAHRFDLLLMAQYRDMDTGRLGHLVYRLSGIKIEFLTVNGNLHEASFF